LGAVARDIEAALDGVQFDAGYHPEVLGEYESQRRLIALGVVSLLCILFGGVVAVFLTGGVLSLGSLVGFVTVLGIAARNGIMLISHYRHLEHEEHVLFGRELAMRGVEDRL
jgi:Cu/Ag efflux pump CusA